MPPNAKPPYPDEFIADRKRDLIQARAWLESDLRSLGEAEVEAPRSSAPGPAALALSLTPAELLVSPRASAVALLREVQDAMARLDAGLYGWDPAAGRWIRAARLAAVPTARHEIFDRSKSGAD